MINEIRNFYFEKRKRREYCDPLKEVTKNLLTISPYLLS